MIRDHPSFNGTVDTTKADQHQYTYSFNRTITSDMCGKYISYQATGFHNVSGSSLIILGNGELLKIENIQKVKELFKCTRLKTILQCNGKQ